MGGNLGESCDIVLQQSDVLEVRLSLVGDAVLALLIAVL
jgi:hypothetical protein